MKKFAHKTKKTVPGRGSNSAGFTLVEVVIVMAIIGLLALMIIPQYKTVQETANLRAFQSNCRTICYVLGAFQAGHDGELPGDDVELGTYLNGGWDSLNRPSGAIYRYDNNEFTARYTTSDGTVYEYRYPD